MRKYKSANKLRTVCGAAGVRSYRASAFSLAELVVALGILVLMFALAGQVFNVTVQSTGQATAIVQVNQQKVWQPRQLMAEFQEAKKNGRKFLLLLVEGVNGFRFSLLPVR